ncbi:MAG: MmcQ/YjbR family DNA-binding protein [Christensenellaceae bacterium]|jgi:predicted DNA-binding protein (MmcQ/YjbR family)|nr:MmcQ/YjbR family DNA-binding protein [Christensenellaceae bacterium]
MTKRDIIDICLSLKDSYEDYPFDLDASLINAWAVIRHKSNKRGFAHIYIEGEKPIVNIKLHPAQADFYRQAYSSIKPAYHMNKEHWSGIDPNGDVPIELLMALVETSYDLTKPKSKK